MAVVKLKDDSDNAYVRVYLVAQNTLSTTTFIGLGCY